MTPQQFLELANLLPEAMFLIDGEGNVLAANTAVQRLGLARQQVIGRRIYDLTLNRSEDVVHYLGLCLRSRSGVVGSLTFSSDGTSRVPCRVHGASIETEVGGTRQILLRFGSKDATISRFLELNEQLAALTKEVKQRRVVESELRQQKEWLQVTLNSIGDAVIATATDGSIVFMNPVAETYLGYSEGEVIGKSLTEVFRIINEETRLPVENPVDKVIQRGVVVGLANHTILLHRDGSERPIEDSAAPILDEHGKLLGVILVFHDVTEQRVAERELRLADRRKDEFLATLAHELRNPLAPIRNSLELLRQLGLSADGAVHIAHETMDRQLKHMVRLVDDLLDISRISRGKFELQMQAVDMRSVLKQAVETCFPILDTAKHELRVDLPDIPAYATADPVRLCQAFSNLLNNACKFTPPGGRIELVGKVDDSRFVVRVKDNGIGIDAEQQNRVFEMFSQVDSSITRSQGGLGIGLTLTKRIIELHNGSIEVFSSGVGNGSEFKVEIPVTNNAKPVGEKSALASVNDNYQILVIDDNRDSANSLAMLLRFAGHTTRTAYDAETGLAIAESFVPDVILLDIGLPTISGYEACQKFRATRRSPEPVIIALTGWGQAEDRRKSAAAGFDHHVVKPVDFEAILSIIDSCTKRVR